MPVHQKKVRSESYPRNKTMLTCYLEHWYCWKCEGQAGKSLGDDPISSSSSSSSSDTDDESDTEIARKKAPQRNYLRGANVTTLGQAATDRNPKGANWSPQEKQHVAALMHEVMLLPSDVSRTEKRWEKVRHLLLERYDISRTHTAIKNYWNREGRRDSGLDERKKPNPNKLVTGVQDPADRKALREAKKKAEKDAQKTDTSTRRQIKGEDDDSEKEVFKPIIRNQKRRTLVVDSDDEDKNEPAYIPSISTSKRQRRNY